MTQPVIVHRKGDISMQDDYMDFINYVFGFNGNSSDFYKLLPKLYKPEYNPAASSYVTLEDGKLKAAIGAFDINLNVCDTRLYCRGIGNVAVHPFSRSKGYMKKLMETALDDMVADGVDLSVLGGRRQRYNYFSYERGGVSYSFTVNSDNMRHIFGKDRSCRFEPKKVTADNTDALAEIAALSESMPFYAERKVLYDTLVSWQSVPYAAYENCKFVGYAIVKKDRVSEIFVKNPADFADMIICLFDKVICGTFNFTLPEFCRDYLKTAYGFCEGVGIGSNEMYSVLNYHRVCEAFMKLKTTYTTLPDGELCISIDGRAGKENLLFGVEGGVPTVSKTDREPQLVFGHIEAENVLFSHFSPLRDELPDFAKLWFPLPIWIYSPDMV